MTKYLPESEYKLDSALTRENFKKGDIVTGRVEIIMKSKKFFIIDLGGTKAHMLFEESTIYQSRESSKGYVDPNIYALLGKIIRAKVVDVGESIIMISRKELMHEALNYFKSVNPDKFTVSITAFNKLSAFVDVGSGIHGRIIPSEFAAAHFNKIEDVGLSIGDTFVAKNLAYNEQLKSFDLSRIAAISDEPNKFTRDDQVNFKVFKTLDDGEGYLGLIDKKYPALLDSRNVKLHYCDEVTGVVKEVTPKGIKLKFDSFICNFDDISS